MADVGTGPLPARPREVARYRRTNPLTEDERLMAQRWLLHPHYVAEHERLATLVGTIGTQMLRARRLLSRLEKHTPSLASGGGL